MFLLTVVSEWVDTEGMFGPESSNVSRVGKLLCQAGIRHSTINIGDQPSADIPPDPNAIVVRIETTAAGRDLILADAETTILSDEELPSV